MKPYRLFAFTLGLLLSCSTLASAEILALLNYESKTDQPVRREGIAIMDIDPESGNFGKILMEIPLPPDLVAHHIFSRIHDLIFNRNLTGGMFTVFDLFNFPNLFCHICLLTLMSKV